MKQKKKKTPADYPQIAFRITSSQKHQIMSQIDLIHEIANKNSKAGEFKINRNDIFVEAIEKGLKQVKKRYANQ